MELTERPEPDLSGGMIPAVAPPFAMTRWTPQTRQHCMHAVLRLNRCAELADVSMCPYNQTDTMFHGFLGTHQPAIWMGTLVALIQAHDQVNRAQHRSQQAWAKLRRCSRNEGCHSNRRKNMRAPIITAQSWTLPTTATSWQS